MKYVPPLGATDPNASYHDGNPEAGILGSIVPAAAIERPQREILSVLAAAGIVPSDTDNAQLAVAISALILAQKIKLTDRVNLTDSTTAASATAVKTAYDAAQSKLPLSGGTVTGSLSIKNMLDLIGTAPATEQELGVYHLDKNGNIMGAHDFVHNINNIKAAQMYARNSNGLISSLGVYVEEDGTRYILSSHNIIITSDVEIGRLYADGVRLITFSGTKSSPGLMMRYSPDSGELYLDGRAVHGKADTAGNADTANYANSAGSALIAAPAVQWVVNLSGPQITVPPGGTYNVVCICFNDSGGKGAVKDYPNIAGGTVIPNASTDYMVAGLCARVA